MEIIMEEDISMHDAKRIMEERKKERDLIYDQKICLEYLEKVAKLTPTQTKNLVEELGKISILKPRYIALILNMLPDTEEEVEALFSKERTNLKKEEIKQIVEIVSKYKK
jgi:DNA-directed RNA polymerase subunit F